MEMEIVKYPDPILRRRAPEVEEITDELKAKVRAMFPAMYKAKGLGLAAPQIGWSIRIFVANVTGKPGDERAFLNPEIVSRKGKQVGEEGCLSFPGLNAKLERALQVRLAAFDLDGNEFSVDAEGLLARAFQHEMDHLDGVLLIDRMSAAEKALAKRRLKELEAEFEERRGAAAHAGHAHARSAACADPSHRH